MATIQLQCEDRQVVQPLPAVCMYCGRPSARVEGAALASIPADGLLSRTLRILHVLFGDALLLACTGRDYCWLEAPVCQRHHGRFHILTHLWSAFLVLMMFNGVMAYVGVREGHISLGAVFWGSHVPGVRSTARAGSSQIGSRPSEVGSECHAD